MGLYSEFDFKGRFLAASGSCSKDSTIPLRISCKYLTLLFNVHIQHADEPPDVTCMRCVPAAWCVPTSVTPTKVWDDTGAGGGKPGSIWTVNSLDMVAVVAGHEAPKDIFYEFKSQSFSLEGTLPAGAGAAEGKH
jgi:hypothetical protein